MVKCFFIIGAPRSGTTSLFRWLDAHPSLQGSSPKEPFFFMDSGHPLHGRHDGDGSVSSWQALFSEPSFGRIRFEATTHYFYQNRARECISACRPQPHVFFVLREPATRILSSFLFTRDVLGNASRRLTFDMYVHHLLRGNLDKIRPLFYSTSSFWIAEREIELSTYVYWVKWWLKRMAPEAFHIILFDEIRRDAYLVVERICRILGVDPSFYNDFAFSARNSSYQVRAPRVHRIARRLAEMTPAGVIKDHVRDAYMSLLKAKGSLHQNEEAGLAALRGHFASANEELLQKHGLDLQYWCPERVELLNPQELQAEVRH